MFHELDRHLLKITPENTQGTKIHTYTYIHTYIHTYILIYLLTYSLTPCSTVLLEKLTGSQPVKKFPVFYGTRGFITVLTRARHLSLLEPDQSSPSPIPLPEDPSSNLMYIFYCLHRTKGSFQVRFISICCVTKPVFIVRNC
jgi:hypothetical protein